MGQEGRSVGSNRWRSGEGGHAKRRQIRKLMGSSRWRRTGDGQPASENWVTQRWRWSKASMPWTGSYAVAVVSVYGPVRYWYPVVCKQMPAVTVPTGGLSRCSRRVGQSCCLHGVVPRCMIDDERLHGLHCKGPADLCSPYGRLLVLSCVECVYEVTSVAR